MSGSEGESHSLHEDILDGYGRFIFVVLDCILIDELELKVVSQPFLGDLPTTETSPDDTTN